ncbi:MAG: DUF1460 domain-containing protein [Bacteroidales bacterium]|nr:DUF1460 domain-containing protein [Bacteroidales bacterium]
MKFVTSILLLCASLSASGQVRWNNEASDTTRITQILTETAALPAMNPSARVAFIARKFIDTPYVAHTLEGDSELLTINLDQLDCTTLVDVVLAMAYTVGERRTGWQDFVYNLQRMRYRGGEIDGYASRLHYNCDWAVDNSHRGFIADVARDMPKCSYMVRTIDFMSQHRDNYPALADSATFARIKEVENGFRNHRFGYIKTVDLTSRDLKAALRDGDILAFVSSLKDLDVTHLGIVVKVDGEPHVLHASSTEGRVVVSSRPLSDFVKRNRNWIGVRVYRLKD